VSRQYDEVMLTRWSRSLLALAAFCVFYAGPVAACVCTMDSMADMPCCPDQGPDAADCALPDAEVGSACEPLSADALTSASFDFVGLPAMVAAPIRLRSADGPPTVPIPARPAIRDDTPLYLVTLRLRN
jgi:hypothetical protein